MSLVGTASPTSKTLKKRCSSASRRISRSGLIRELNETRANCRRAGKISAARLGIAKRGEGREALTRLVDNDVDFCELRPKPFQTVIQGITKRNGEGNFVLHN